MNKIVAASRWTSQLASNREPYVKPGKQSLDENIIRPERKIKSKPDLLLQIEDAKSNY